jgi:hypothetical protein
MVNVKTGQTTEIVLISDYEYHAPEDDLLSPTLNIADGRDFLPFFKDCL